MLLWKFPLWTSCKPPLGKGGARSPWSLLQAEQPQLKACLHRRGVLVLCQLSGPSLDSFQEIYTLLLLGAPEPDAVLQWGSPEGTVEGQNQTLLSCFWCSPGHSQVSASAHCQLILSFSFTNTLRCFSPGLVLIHPPSSLYLCLGLPWLRSMTLYLDYK